MIVVLPEIVPVCPGFFVTVGYHLPSCARHQLKGKTHHSERYASDGRNSIFFVLCLLDGSHQGDGNFTS